MTDKQKLQKIYNDNLKIETFHALKANPPLAGSIAKKLINNCKRALVIIDSYDTTMIKKLTRSIEEMEDELASNEKISTLTYNMGARINIHVSIECMRMWVKKDD